MARMTKTGNTANTNMKDLNTIFCKVVIALAIGYTVYWIIRVII